VSSSTPCVWCADATPRQAVLELAEGRFLSRCMGCGAIALSPPPDDEELRAAYAATYYGEGNRRFLPPLEAAVRWFRARRARDIDRRVRRGQSVGDRADSVRPRALDIGCGRGFLLADLRDLGWEVRGVELSDVAARHARERLGLAVEVGNLEALRFPPASYDCIILWHVLEHLRDPAEILRRCAVWLRPGGQLVLAVPNLASWQAAWGGAAWFHLDPPRHLHHCAASDLRQWLVSRGFGIGGESHFCWEQNPFGWLQTLHNRIGRRLGWPQNLLYDLLKRAGARSVAPGVAPTSRRALAVALGVLGLVPAIALSGAEAVARRGGTVTLYAFRTPGPNEPSSG
jgi:2-polyprenyl-3-methyl-5-hydroxy-6-metoxy-1,4-benzoquinol methylase